MQDTLAILSVTGAKRGRMGKSKQDILQKLSTARAFPCIRAIHSWLDLSALRLFVATRFSQQYGPAVKKKTSKQTKTQCHN